MGRRRTKNHGLPPLMAFRRGRYFYGRNQIALGASFPEALRKYAEMHGAVSARPTFAEAMAAYLKDCARLKPSTRREYDRQSVVLLRVFGATALVDIRPSDVERYLAVRGRTIAATREKALLSAVYNFGRRTGLVNIPNPCTGIRGRKSKRDRYVTDAELRAALDAADPTLAAFLELAYRTGQRPSDVLKMTRLDVQDGALAVVQGKTGAKVRIALSGPLAGLVARLSAGTVGAVRLIRDRKGRAMTLAAIRKRWDRVRDKIGADWQLRDLRAKAASDLPDVARARGLLGHRDETTTGIYRRRIGEVADPVSREIAGKPD